MATSRERHAVPSAMMRTSRPPGPTRAPDLGDHDVEIRRELSFDEGPIKSMQKDGGV